MKTFLPVFLSLCLTSVAQGAFIYFDNFAQFPNGTVLTETNYVPVIGPWAEISTNDVKSGETYATVVASNLLGGTRAFFNLATVPYRQSYEGTPTIAATSQVLTLSWKLWIEAVKAPSTTLGGVAAQLTVTNLDIFGSTTNCDRNWLLFFDDAGQVFAFTNAPSAGSPPIQIGTWATLAGTVMTNQLVLNYPTRTCQFSINGNVLTNMAIPGYVTNFLDVASMEIFEASTGGVWGMTASTGNQFALGDVLLTSGTESISGIRTVGTNVLVSIQSVSNENYQLQFGNSMTPTNWSNVAGASVSNAIGGLLTVTNFGGASSPQGFYRFIVTP
jgi:hypothetical protein